MTVSTLSPSSRAIMPSLAQAAKAPTVPAHMLPHRTPAELIAIARLGLAEATQTPADGLRYATAHLAALRAAAAVLAVGLSGAGSAAESGPAAAKPAAPPARRKFADAASFSLPATCSGEALVLMM